MIYSVKTDYGRIKIEKEALAGVICDVIDGFGGKVKLANDAGKPITAPPADTDRTKRDKALDKYHERAASEMDVTIGEDRLIDVTFCVVINLGISISSTSESIIRLVKEQAEASLGIKLNTVTVMTTGVVSKKIAKRNIVYVG